MRWQQKLLTWYRQHQRDLPWRRRPTPYRVLVSEVMLQQTTVKTVIPYYRNFLKKFPSMRSLASSPEEKVLAAWSGLGYYSRARNLHKTAQICLQEYKGKLPDNADTLIKLPGIGAYTAGAIASIAYDQPAPIVDGNVARVLSRIFRMKADPKSASGLKEYWRQARQQMLQHDCGDYNQALMELGATICTPTHPLCQLCPVRKNCLAFLEDDPGQYPRIQKRMQYRNVHLSAALIARGKSLLMVKRPNQGALRNMWEFPMIEGEIQDLVSAYSLSLPGGTALRPIRHSIMDQRIRVSPWLFTKTRSMSLPKQSRWFHLADIKQLPSSSLVTKLLGQLPD